MRCMMNEDTGVHYIKPWQVDQTIPGFEGVAVVVRSKSEKFQKGILCLVLFWKPGLPDGVCINHPCLCVCLFIFRDLRDHPLVYSNFLHKVRVS